jgi:hypothetical protein
MWDHVSVSGTCMMFGEMQNNSGISERIKEKKPGKKT